MGTLEVGTEWDSTEASKQACAAYAIEHCFPTKSVKRTADQFEVRCKNDGCTWRLYASKYRAPKFVIKIFVDEHYNCPLAKLPNSKIPNWGRAGSPAGREDIRKATRTTRRMSLLMNCCLLTSGSNPADLAKSGSEDIRSLSQQRKSAAEGVSNLEFGTMLEAARTLP